MAMLLQSLCVRLGVVTGNDLAQTCTKSFPRWVSLILYVLCEIAIMSTDLAEVIGSAIAMNLLFGIPLVYGVLITATDVMFILFFWNKRNLRFFEGMIIVLVFITAGCLFTVMGKSEPVFADVMRGFLPSWKIITEPGSIYVAVGIIGATVMPHNLYLHSSIVKYRGSIDARTPGEIVDFEIEDDTLQESELQPLRRKVLLPTTLQMSYIDSIAALAFALLINSSILIIASSNFYSVGRTDVADIPDAFQLIGEMLGKWFSSLFAIGLLLSGQTSTITGTMAGQIVMEGFLGSQFKVKPWIRRLITRIFAVVPALICIFVYGEQKLNDLLILSQIILSLQLPFAVWPLVYFTSSQKIMTVYYNQNSSMDALDVGTLK
jgi:manganese transport protein